MSATHEMAAAPPPEQAHDTTARGAIPPGWSYNPSGPAARRVLLALAGVGLLNALYIALFQWGVIPHLWDPVFGAHSSFLVTHSRVSRLLPFPDGTLG
ncbi:MAG: hypothetical protein IVW57_09095, partial [Ktedonobacterales bacterium]|nr:hypothetical protein [Ktedonobacterales bacterium]